MWDKVQILVSKANIKQILEFKDEQRESFNSEFYQIISAYHTQFPQGNLSSNQDLTPVIIKIVGSGSDPKYKS